MFGVTSLIVSGLLIAGLFSLRFVEVNRGGRYAPSLRVKLDSLALKIVDVFIHGMPRFIIRSSKYLLIHITDFFSSILLRAVRFIEEKLHIAVHRVRGKKEDLVNGGPSSNHLADMKTHKEAVSKTIEELEEVQ